MNFFHIAAIAAIAWPGLTATGADWPQFRGPNCSGIAPDNRKLPEKLGPDDNVIWKTPLPPGHSSPAAVGDRIYLTGVQNKRLVTMALDRKDGQVLWQMEAPAKELEKVHRIGSHAQPSPAADADGVISFFGSSGLLCYDRDGKLRWNRPLGPFKNDFGAGSSPIIVGNRVLLCQDHDQDSFLIAVDRQTGEIIWKTDRSEFLRGYCTPVVIEIDGRKQIVVAGTLRVAGYDLDSGKELWTVQGIARTICATPVVGEDSRLYLAGWAAGGDPGEPIEVEPFDATIKQSDKNNNGKLEKAEITSGPYVDRFSQVDTDKDGSITRAEYDRFRTLFQKGQNAVVAVRPGGKGDVTGSHVAWKNNKQVPFCASPLLYRGSVYVVKDGGLFGCLDAKDGKPLKYDRLPNPGNYYASPVAGDGKVYVVNERGRLAVIRAGADWTVLSSSDFKEDVYATPAIADGRVYVRTSGHLYCFGLK